MIVEEEASDDEAAAVQRVFDEAGFPAVVSPRYGRHSAKTELLPWVLVIKISVTAFLTALAGAAGTDAWRALKALVVHIFEVRRRSDRRDGAIQLQDGNVTIILTDRISDEGFQQVAGRGLPPGRHFVWDEKTQTWKGY